MAERSFAKEVQKLRTGAGEVFHGEGILAVTKGLLQSGVSYVGGYQGSPISHLMDVLADAHDILDELGVHFESSASEATAGAMLAASVNYPLRGAVTWKSTVGTNVASDALANVSSGGVTGGALIIIGEDYGEGSSIMQERTHAFAMKSQIWLIDPRPDLGLMVDLVEKSFELSEASNTPVMFQMRIRACHVHGQFHARDNKRPEMSLRHAMENSTRDTSRIVLPPANFLHEKEKIHDRWPAAEAFIKEHALNEYFGPKKNDIGIIVQGGLFNTLNRALELLGLSDSFANSTLPIYVLNVAYPLIPDEILNFCRDKSSVLIVEEGQPDFIEQNLHAILRRAGIATKIYGKDVLTTVGEYTGDIIKEGLQSFLKAAKPDVFSTIQQLAHPPFEANSGEMTIPPRPAGFCTGCPERPVFTAIQLLEEEMGKFHISCDIGCHLFSILPPFNLGNTTMGYGLGWAGAAAFNTDSDKRTISIMGDGGFWHNGLTSGVGNAVFNQNDNILVIVDNNYAAATGGQDLLSSRADNATRSTGHEISDAVKGVGVTWVKTVKTYDLKAMYTTIHDAATTDKKGPKVIIAQSECQLNRQRRVKPIFNKAVADGKRMVRERFYVDSETCTGDHACIRLSGCPSLTLKSNPNPLKKDPVAYVDNSCVGCGHCGEVAHAAVLCPSFARIDVVINPTMYDRFKNKIRTSIIEGLQSRRQKKIHKKNHTHKMPEFSL